MSAVCREVSLGAHESGGVQYPERKPRLQVCDVRYEADV